ncbi:TadE-like protein [Novosphingobium kunmingense]|uniref:TadE-like protein n=1 Tax=Novosphingobium kunmingense TaxID=1211806 RepID=A0A2N0I2X4_9SPHN|nr:TadE/TadG family type IV pilus assembly protein [Novosphingobium kunmingense]PKB25500.1 TadE-like protein [Novosphingobium kunmingense]
MISLLARLLRDNAGTAVVETALVTPALLLMSLGTYQVSQVVARQHELQSGADQAMSIALAGWSDNTTQIDAMRAVIKRSTGVSDDKITIERIFRCNEDPDYVTDKATCPADAIIATFLKLKLNDTYNPTWTKMGVGKPINLGVTRMVQVS